MQKHPDGDLDRKAGLGARFAAIFIDGIILFILTIILLFLLGAVAGAAVNSGAGDGILAGLGIMFYLVTIVVQLGYYIGMEAEYGQTLGKKALNIVVKTDGGGPIGWGEAAIRNILRIVDYLPTLYLLGVILIAVTDDEQRLGDIAASTVVVDEA